MIGKKIGLWLFVAAVLLTSCAKYGTGPTGGPVDLAPPRMIKALPANGQTGFGQQKIYLDFDEYVVLNATDKIVVSPLLRQVSYEANLKQVMVTINDTLAPDMTYSINFKDAIGDLHEMTPARNLTYVFSTGESVDSGRVSGKVLDAKDYKPVADAKVLLYASKPQSYPVMEDPDYVATTDTAGVFHSQYMKEGCYYVLVTTDENLNYRVDPTEERMAFSSECIQTQMVYNPVQYKKRPGQKESDVSARQKYDSVFEAQRTSLNQEIVSLNQVLYMFQDRVDTVFLKEAKAEKLGEIQLTWYYPLPLDSVRFHFLPSLEDVEMAALYDREMVSGRTSDTVDSLEGENVEALDGKSRTKDNSPSGGKRDRGEREKRMRNRDSDREGEFVRPNLLWPDSVRWFAVSEKDPLVTKLYYNNLGVTSYRLVVEYKTYSDTAEIMLEDRLLGKDTADLQLSQKIGSLFFQDSLPLSFNFPVDTFEVSGMLMKQVCTDDEGRSDTLMITNDKLAFDRTGAMGFALKYEWKPGCSYSLMIPSACVSDWFGRNIDTTEFRFSVPSTETYGQLAVQLQGLEETRAYILQLLSGSDVVKTMKVGQGGLVEFPYLSPAYYTMVLFEDNNRNGQWDVGYYPDGLQPERRWFFPKRLQVEADWRIEETWKIE